MKAFKILLPLTLLATSFAYAQSETDGADKYTYTCHWKLGQIESDVIFQQEKTQTNRVHHGRILYYGKHDFSVNMAIEPDGRASSLGFSNNADARLTKEIAPGIPLEVSGTFFKVPASMSCVVGEAAKPVATSSGPIRSPGIDPKLCQKKYAQILGGFTVNGKPLFFSSMDERDVLVQALSSVAPEQIIKQSKNSNLSDEFLKANPGLSVEDGIKIFEISRDAFSKALLQLPKTKAYSSFAEDSIPRIKMLDFMVSGMRWAQNTTEQAGQDLASQLNDLKKIVRQNNVQKQLREINSSEKEQEKILEAQRVFERLIDIAMCEGAVERFLK